MLSRFFLTLFLLFACLQVSASETYWDLDTAANQVSSTDRLQLLTSNNRVQQTISKEYILKFYEVKNKIANKAGIYPKVLISDSQDVNAYATWQNGQPVTIFTLGILNKIGDDTDALAAVVGHEFSHLTLQHAKSSQNTAFIVDLLAGLALIAIDSRYQAGANNPYHGWYKTGLDLVSNLTLKAYSRGEELEADTHGVRYMLAAGYSAEGAIRLQEHIIPTSASFFSTHPSSSSRIENIRTALNTYTGKEATPQPYQPAIYAQTTVANTKSNTYVEDSKYSSYSQACLEKGLDPNSSLFDACVFKEKKASETASLNSTATSNLPYKGQIGSLVSTRNEQSYIIFSSSIPNVIPNGTKVSIGDGSTSAKGLVARSYDGYYVVELSDTSHIKQGDRVFIDN